MRGIFFDEDHARTVVARLIRDGFEAALSRERLAGEDDDEDHPWAVRTDAPEFVLELFVDEYDGWLDADEGLDGLDKLDRRDDRRDEGRGGRPLPLPDGPRRIKKPDSLG